MHLLSKSFNYLKLNEYVIAYVDLLILLLQPSFADKKKSAEIAITFNGEIYFPHNIIRH